MSKSLGGLQPHMRHVYLQLMRELGGAFATVDTIRTLEEQKRYIREGKSFTMDSYHLLGLAADVAIADRHSEPGVLRRAVKLSWDDRMKFMDMGYAAVRLGLRSFALTHFWDEGHLEYPQIFQTESDCFTYSMVNAMQWSNVEWRVNDKKECYLAAESIEQEMKGKRWARSIRGALEAAKRLRYINEWEERTVDKATATEMLKNRQPILFGQKRVFGFNPTEGNIARRLETGKGIPSHAVCGAFVDADGVWVVNSHKEFPTYRIDWDKFDDVVRVSYTFW